MPLDYQTDGADRLPPQGFMFFLRSFAGHLKIELPIVRGLPVVVSKKDDPGKALRDIRRKCDRLEAKLKHAGGRTMRSYSIPQPNSIKDIEPISGFHPEWKR